jgi:hypothetical protein
MADDRNSPPRTLPQKVERWQRNDIRFSKDWPANQVLTCPHCGAADLYHGAVTIFEREGGNEDAEVTLVTTVDNGSAATEPVASRQTRNPSERRGGLAVAFECEMCRTLVELTLAQHKGTTMIEWRYQPDPATRADQNR